MVRPARYLHPGQSYWSRSYMDPYSLEPMVTCTVPIMQEGRFWGVATVDIRLDGVTDVFTPSNGAAGRLYFCL